MIIRAKSWIALLIVMCTAAACQPQTDDSFVLPTLAELPTLMPSATPTHTLTPTPTPTATATPTLTPTATQTPRPTLTPTASRTPTPTSTPSHTPTITRTPTPTPVPPTRTPVPTSTPVPTFTPVPTNTPDVPVILQFFPSAPSVPDNSTVTLSWATQNTDSARVEQLNPQGAVINVFGVIPNGQLPVLLSSGQGRPAIFRLVAIRGANQVAQTISVGISCTIPWFFGDQLAPPDAGCPQSLGAIGPGAYQPFERGWMIYVNANTLNRIYGLQFDSNRYIVYVNGWDGVTINSSQTPPPNLFIPQQMFNWVYYNTLAPIGAWNQQLGWATANIDTSNRTIQSESGTGRFYIDAPGNLIFRFSGGDSGQWTRIR